MAWGPHIEGFESRVLGMDAREPNLGFGLGPRDMAGPICWGQLSSGRLEDWTQLVSYCILVSRVENLCEVSSWALHISPVLGVLCSSIGLGFVLKVRESCVQALESPVWRVSIPGLKVWNSENLSSMYG